MRQSDKRSFEIYESEIALVKEEFFDAGNAASMWQRMMATSQNTLLAAGFRSGVEVRRLADRFGRRV